DARVVQQRAETGMLIDEREEEGAPRPIVSVAAARVQHFLEDGGDLVNLRPEETGKRQIPECLEEVQLRLVQLRLHGLSPSDFGSRLLIPRTPDQVRHRASGYLGRACSRAI